MAKEREEKKGNEKYFLASNLHYHNKGIKGFVPFVLSAGEELPEDAPEDLIKSLLIRKVIITASENEKIQSEKSKKEAEKKAEIKR